MWFRLLLLLLLLVQQLADALKQANGLRVIAVIRAVVALCHHNLVVEILRLVLISHLILNRLDFHEFLILILCLLLLLELLAVMG